MPGKFCSSHRQVLNDMENIYYDGTKLLNSLDLDGEKPAIYLCTGNRTAGKTTYFNRYVVNRFIKHGEKFALLFRFDYELDNCADKFFKDIRTLFFEGYEMRSEKREKGKFHELFLNDKPCGYAICLNSSDIVKKNSHYFSDVIRILFDEFQSETGKYCKEEIKAFRSIYTSIARGQGKQSRYVQVLMLSNTITLLNPYYIALGISGRLRKDTKYLRGKGFVLELTLNQYAAKEMQESRFNQAFEDTSYVDFAAQNVYLDDNATFIENPKGKSRYLGTLIFKGREYALREFADLGIVYCDDRPDSTYPFKIAITTNDHDINYVMLKKNDLFLTSLRWYFDRGCFRFKNLACKDALLTALCIY